MIVIESMSPQCVRVATTEAGRHDDEAESDCQRCLRHHERWQCHCTTPQILGNLQDRLRVKVSGGEADIVQVLLGLPLTLPAGTRARRRRKRFRFE